MSSYLFSGSTLKETLGRISRHRPLLFFFDYDGTLAFFKNSPEQATPVPGIPDILTFMQQQPRVQISLITGRSLDSLRQVIQIKGALYAAQHGLEIKTGDNHTDNKLPADRQDVKQTLSSIKNFILKKFPYQLEDKGLVLTLHHPPDIDQEIIKKQLGEMVDTDKYQIMKGRQIVEIRPRGWHKGKAVQLITERILEQYPDTVSPLTLYLGDDTTDEDAFATLDRDRGISIFIKNQDPLTTAADYYLYNPLEVLRFLEQVQALFT